jgi:hypothetical protein
MAPQSGPGIDACMGVRPQVHQFVLTTVPVAEADLALRPLLAALRREDLDPADSDCAVLDAIASLAEGSPACLSAPARLAVSVIAIVHCLWVICSGSFLLS